MPYYCPAIVPSLSSTSCRGFCLVCLMLTQPGVQLHSTMSSELAASAGFASISAGKLASVLSKSLIGHA